MLANMSVDGVGLGHVGDRMSNKIQKQFVWASDFFLLHYPSQREASFLLLFFFNKEILFLSRLWRVMAQLAACLDDQNILRRAPYYPSITVSNNPIQVLLKWTVQNPDQTELTNAVFSSFPLHSSLFYFTDQNNYKTVLQESRLAWAHATWHRFGSSGPFPLQGLHQELMSWTGN